MHLFQGWVTAKALHITDTKYSQYEHTQVWGWFLVFCFVFPILKFIVIWAGIIVFSLLQSHVNFSKKYLTKIFQYLIFASDSTYISSTFMSFSVKAWHFSANTWSTKAFFIWKQQYTNSASEGESLLSSDPAQKQMCQMCDLPRHFWDLLNTLHQRKPHLRLRKTEGATSSRPRSQYGTASSPARNKTVKIQFVWEHFGCLVVGSL